MPSRLGVPANLSKRFHFNHPAVWVGILSEFAPGMTIPMHNLCAGAWRRWAQLLRAILPVTIGMLSCALAIEEADGRHGFKLYSDGPS